jgi:hypothetical protein
VSPVERQCHQLADIKHVFFRIDLLAEMVAISDVDLPRLKKKLPDTVASLQYVSALVN